MDVLKDVGHELGIHATEGTLGSTLVQNLVVSIGLQHRHVMLLLVLTDLAAHLHTLGKQVHQLVVELIDLLTQLGDALRLRVLIADDEQREDVVEHIGRHLLLGVAPGLIGIAVALDDQTVEAEVHRLLTERRNEFATAADMRGIADDRQLGDATAQLDGNLPHRGVAVDLLLVAGEAAMDGPQTLDASLIDALKGTNPQFKVRVDGVLHEHGHIGTFQRIGDSLHGEGVSRCAGANPEDINAILQGELHVLGGSHLGRDEHLGLLLHLSEPHEGRFAVALEASGFGTGFPYAGTEVVAAFHCQFTGSCHHLFLGLGRARACNHEGTFVVTR